ncbi:MAG TPA: helix-turn-helix domain-containing protein [Kineosporiaceae bacterium]|nr:helix-turn-helix domain-containing protein [Kineosporiaceae bacterium]
MTAVVGGGQSGAPGPPGPPGLPGPPGTAEGTLGNLVRGAGALATAALQSMDERLSWFRAMAPQDRSWVGLVAQAGISAFLDWYRAGGGAGPQVSPDVFGTAPRELTRSVSLQQALELLRTVVDTVEAHVPALAAPGDEQQLREAVLRYSREVAFAAARIYARAAEARGAWDARLEALVVDALLRGEADDALRSRAAALGWAGSDQVTVVAGGTPPGLVGDVVAALRRAAAGAGADALFGVQGDRMVVVLGRRDDPLEAARGLARHFGKGPVVTGPVVPTLAEAGRSARAALAGLVAARAWPDAPRPVAADDLLPERLLSGDAVARRTLVDRVYRRLAEADPALLATAAAYLDAGRSVEAAARQLFVHPNTVRYRLKGVAKVTGWEPSHPREGFVLQVAIAVGRLADAPRTPFFGDSSKRSQEGS